MILIVLVWVQVILGLTWGKDHPVPLLLFGLVVLAIMIQVGRWLIPMARERRRNRR